MRGSLRDTYHHGDLRRELLAAALELVSERGVDDWSLREAAKRAGVSHAAPYHHFASKAQLLDELSRESWALLANRLDATRSRTDMARLEALVAAYVGFAVDHPGRFRVMLHRGLTRPGARPSPTGLVVFQVLEAAVEEAQSSGFARSGDVAPLVLTLWATMHGFAALVVAGPLADQTPPALAEPLAAVVAETVSTGVTPS